MIKDIEVAKLEEIITVSTGTIPGTSNTVEGELWFISFSNARVVCRAGCNQTPDAPCPVLKGIGCLADNTLVVDERVHKIPGDVYCGKIGFYGGLVKEMRPQADRLG